MKSKEKTEINPIKLNLLKGYRIKSGLSTEEMANFLEIRKTNYSQKELGYTRITISDLIIIARALNLSLEEIIELFEDNYLNSIDTFIGIYFDGEEFKLLENNYNDSNELYNFLKEEIKTKGIS